MQHPVVPKRKGEKKGKSKSVVCGGVAGAGGGPRSGVALGSPHGGTGGRQAGVARGTRECAALDGTAARAQRVLWLLLLLLRASPTHDRGGTQIVRGLVSLWFARTRKNLRFLHIPSGTLEIMWTENITVHGKTHVPLSRSGSYIKSHRSQYILSSYLIFLYLIKREKKS